MAPYPVRSSWRGGAAVAAYDVEKQSQCSTRRGALNAPDEGLLGLTSVWLTLCRPVLLRVGLFGHRVGELALPDLAGRVGAGLHMHHCIKHRFFACTRDRVAQHTLGVHSSGTRICSDERVTDE